MGDINQWTFYTENRGVERRGWDAYMHICMIYIEALAELLGVISSVLGGSVSNFVGFQMK